MAGKHVPRQRTYTQHLGAGISAHSARYEAAQMRADGWSEEEIAAARGFTPLDPASPPHVPAEQAVTGDQVLDMIATHPAETARLLIDIVTADPGDAATVRRAMAEARRIIELPKDDGLAAEVDALCDSVAAGASALCQQAVADIPDPQELAGRVRDMATVLDRDPTPETAKDVAARLRTLYAAILRLAGPPFAVALVAALALGLTVTGTPAQAAAIPVTRPVVVTVTGPTARITLDVITTKQTRGVYRAVVFAGNTVITGTSRTPLVHVTGTVASRDLDKVTVARALDVADNTIATIPLQVIRQSTVTVTGLYAYPGGILILGRAAHYDLPSSGLKGDQYSQVQVQVLRAGRWATVASLPTALDGTIVGAVTLPAGKALVRLQRLPGTTVTGGVSPARTVTIPRP